MNPFFANVRLTLKASVMHAMAGVGAFLPKLLSACLILIAGWLIAAVVSRLVGRALRGVQADRIAEKRGVTQTLADLGFTGTVSGLISDTVYWVILLLSILPTVEALHLDYFTLMVARVLGYLPTVIAAAVILLAGLSFARFLSNALVRSARKGKLEYAGALGIVCRYFISLIVVVITLAQLGVQTAILTIVLAVVLISAGLATALALGFGSRAVVSNLLAGSFVRDHFPVGRVVDVQGVRGTVIAVHAVSTDLKGESGSISVPNTVLMENVVE